MEKTRKPQGDKKLIIGAVVLLVISAILFSLATEQGTNLIKNIQEAAISLYENITGRAVNTTEAKVVGG